MDDASRKLMQTLANDMRATPKEFQLQQETGLDLESVRVLARYAADEKVTPADFLIRQEARLEEARRSLPSIPEEQRAHIEAWADDVRTSLVDDPHIAPEHSISGMAEARPTTQSGNHWTANRINGDDAWDYLDILRKQNDAYTTLLLACRAVTNRPSTENGMEEDAVREILNEVTAKLHEFVPELRNDDYSRQKFEPYMSNVPFAEALKKALTSDEQDELFTSLQDWNMGMTALFGSIHVSPRSMKELRGNRENVARLFNKVASYRAEAVEDAKIPAHLPPELKEFVREWSSVVAGMKFYVLGSGKEPADGIAKVLEQAADSADSFFRWASPRGGLAQRAFPGYEPAPGRLSFHDVEQQSFTDAGKNIQRLLDKLMHGGWKNDDVTSFGYSINLLAGIFDIALMRHKLAELKTDRPRE